MTIKQLKECIENLPDDMQVIIQKDAEGNGYSPLRGADSDAVYVADSTYSGDVYSLEWSAKDACKTEKQWEEIKAMPKCLVLFPIN